MAWLTVLHAWRPLSSIQTHHHPSLFSEIHKHGALMLRSSAVDGRASTFSRFCESLRLEEVDCSESAAVRKEVAPHVWTANEAPPDAPIPFHHEMGQCSSWPRYAFFFCEVEPSARGATPLARSDDLAAACRKRHPSASAELTRRGIRYVRTLPLEDDPASPIGKGWPSALKVTSRAEAETVLARRGLHGTWEDGGDLTLRTGRRSVFRTLNGRDVFFNSAIAARRGWGDARNSPGTSVVYADGTPLAPDAEALFDFADEWLFENGVAFPWRMGDVLCVDNHRVLHARESFEGPRSVLASMWGERKN